MVICVLGCTCVMFTTFIGYYVSQKSLKKGVHRELSDLPKQDSKEKNEVQSVSNVDSVEESIAGKYNQETLGNGSVFDIVRHKNHMETAGNCVEHDVDVDNIQIEEDTDVTVGNKLTIGSEVEHESDVDNIEFIDDDMQIEGHNQDTHVVAVKEANTVYI